MPTVALEVTRRWRSVKGEDGETQTDMCILLGRYFLPKVNQELVLQYLLQSWQARQKLQVQRCFGAEFLKLLSARPMNAGDARKKILLFKSVMWWQRLQTVLINPPQRLPGEVFRPSTSQDIYGEAFSRRSTPPLSLTLSKNVPFLFCQLTSSRF